MDGVHDLGGVAGFGPVDVEIDEPVFHAEWEGRVFALSGCLMMAGASDGPTFRHSIERMDPVHYLGSSYYEHWLTGVATLAVERGLVDRNELVARAGTFPLSRPVAAHPLPDVLAGDPPSTPRFARDDRVRVRNVHPLGHTRCPDYVRGREGTIVRVDHASNVPELEAHRGVKLAETTYCVAFSAAELWGDGDEATTVHVDLYDRYLETP